MSGFIRPQLAALKTRVPKGDQWLHEIKYDGYRIQIHVDGAKRRALIRNGRERRYLDIRVFDFQSANEIW